MKIGAVMQTHDNEFPIIMDLFSDENDIKT